MNCSRCHADAAELRRVHIPDSNQARESALCLVCWGTLVLWLRGPRAELEVRPMAVR
jgi:hypothetical protein